MNILILWSNKHSIVHLYSFFISFVLAPHQSISQCLLNHWFCFVFYRFLPRLSQFYFLNLNARQQEPISHQQAKSTTKTKERKVRKRDNKSKRRQNIRKRIHTHKKTNQNKSTLKKIKLKKFLFVLLDIVTSFLSGFRLFTPDLRNDILC